MPFGPLVGTLEGGGGVSTSFIFKLVLFIEYVYLYHSCCSTDCHGTNKDYETLGQFAELCPIITMNLVYD